MIWIGLFIGFNLGVIAMAMFMAGKRQPACTIDDLEKCRVALCESCDLNKRYEIVKADNKCLGEKINTLRNRIAQISGENSRLYCKLFYQNKIGIAR